MGPVEPVGRERHGDVRRSRERSACWEVRGSCLISAGHRLAAGASAMRLLDGIGSKTTADAPPAAGKHPVILLSPGWGNTSGLHDAQASDLASHGYVVVGIDHPGDTTAVDVGGGRILTMNPAGEKIQNKSAVQRVADVRYVLHTPAPGPGPGRPHP